MIRVMGLAVLLFDSDSWRSVEVRYTTYGCQDSVYVAAVDPQVNRGTKCQRGRR